MLMTTEQRLKDFERALGEYRAFATSVSQMLPPQAAAAKPRLYELFQHMSALRVAALKSLVQGDVNGLIRALGVVHAYEACMTLGIGSMQALTSCTRNQFSLWARPQNLGWGAADAVPPKIEPGIISEVESVLRSLNLRWREAHEKPRVKLPEPVLSQAFNPSFNPKTRFVLSDFMTYAHPSIVQGVPGKFNSIVHELNARGVYCWEDMGLHAISDFRNTGLVDQQLALMQWEARRRGIRFQKEVPMSAVEMEAIDVDKINPENIDEKDALSFEDRIKVRDKIGTVVGVINAANEFEDRVGAEDEVHAGYGEQGASPMGVNEAYQEDGEGELVKDEDETQPVQPAPSPPAQ